MGSVNVLTLELGKKPAGTIRVHRGEIVEAATGRRVASYDALAAALQSASIVLVGEQHDNREHHRIQGEIIDALGRRDPKLVVGLEMLPRGNADDEHILSRYVRGEVDEKTLSSVLRWKKRWGIAFDVYAPVFRAARARHATIVGLNAPRALVRRVARVGLHNLSGKERDQLPHHIDLEVQAHRTLFEAMLGGGGHHHHIARAKLDRYYGAQCVWDAAMAEAAIAAARPGGRAQRRVVIIAGGGHVYYDLGIALRIARRRPALRTASIALVSVAHRFGRDVSRALATYVIGSAPAREEHGSKKKAKKKE